MMSLYSGEYQGQQVISKMADTRKFGQGAALPH
jgi:hypothetical protein